VATFDWNEGKRGQEIRTTQKAKRWQGTEISRNRHQRVQSEPQEADLMETRGKTQAKPRAREVERGIERPHRLRKFGKNLSNETRSRRGATADMKRRNQQTRAKPERKEKGQPAPKEKNQRVAL